MQKTLWFFGKVEVGQGSLKKWTGLHPNSYFENTTKGGPQKHPLHGFFLDHDVF